MTEGMGGRQAAQRVHAMFEAVQAGVVRAHDLGISVLAGTDMLPPGGIIEEIAALQQAGLPPRAALAAASSAARTYLGEPNIEEGAPADLALYPADPRNDPEVLARPAAVFLQGRRISMTSLPDQ